MKKQIPSPTTQINVLRRYLHVLALLQNNKDPMDWNANNLAEMLSEEERSLFDEKAADAGVEDHTVRKYIAKYLKKELGLKVNVVRGSRRTGLEDPLGEDLLRHIASIYSTFVVTDTTREAVLVALTKKHHYDALWLLARIHFAIIARNSIKFDYTAHGKKDPFMHTVNPYHMVFRNNNLYLLGFSHYREKISMFIMNKIENLKVLDTRFSEKIPGIDELFKDPFGSYMGESLTVTVRYTRKIQSRMEQLLGALDNDVTALQEGDLYETSFPVSDTDYLCKQLFLFGRDVEITGPKEVRDRMIRLLRGSMEAYKE